MQIEALAAHHQRRGFSCGEEDLDQYLRHYARQHAAANVSRTYVAAAGPTILGFYSLGFLDEQLSARVSQVLAGASLA